jgi:hypothetical protein
MSYIFWDITPGSPLKVNRLSGEHVASIFRIEIYAKTETSVKQVASRALLVTYPKSLTDCNEHKCLESIFKMAQRKFSFLPYDPVCSILMQVL